jgi:hypothetical protein
MDNEFETMWKEAFMAYFRGYPGMEGLRNLIRNYQDSMCQIQYQVPLEHSSQILPLERSSL